MTPSNITGRSSETGVTSPDGAIVLHSWETRLRILSNPDILRGLFLALGGGSIALSVVFTAITRSVAGLEFGAALFFGLSLVALVICGIIDLFGGFRVRFVVTDRGVHSISGKGAEAAADTAVLAGLLAGNMAAVGVGELARSEQHTAIPYEEVSRVIASLKRGTVVLKGSRWQKPVGMKCDIVPGETVLQTLREKCPAAEFIVK
jgi:hypothetical protein